MPAELTRLTFVVTKDMEPLLARAKKDLFYDRTQSAMIRELIMAGLCALDEKKEEQRCEKAPDEAAVLRSCNPSAAMLEL